MKCAIRKKAFSLLTIVGALISVAPCVAQEYLPPGVNVIDKPFDYVRGINSVSRTENHLVVIGNSDGPGCLAHWALNCPSLHFYGRSGDSWVLQQTVEFAEAGLASVKHIGPNKIVVDRRSENISGSKAYEIAEYELNETTGQWEGTPVSRLKAGGLAYSDGTYLVACDGLLCGNISFIDNVNGEWQETDVMYLSSIRVFDGYYVTQILVDNGLAYVLFCEHQGSCEDTRGIAIIDVASRSVIDYFEVQIPGYAKFALFGNQVLVATDDDRYEPPFQPAQVYENVAGTWLYVGDARSSLEGRTQGINVAQTDETLFVQKQPWVDSHLVEAFVFYQQNVSSEWEQIGSVLIPDGNGFMKYLSMANAFDQAVYILNGVWPDTTRIIEITNYYDFLDRDEDIMPQWWEELYGFSPDAYDDFTRDTDQDDLTDIEEYQYLTSPVSDDTDGDQMPDGWEVQYWFDPRDPSDADQDFDRDGHSNLYEYLNGMNPHVRPGEGDITQGPYTPVEWGGGGSTGLVWIFMLLVGSARRLFKAWQFNLRSPAGLRSKLTWVE